MNCKSQSVYHEFVWDWCYELSVLMNKLTKLDIQTFFKDARIWGKTQNYEFVETKTNDYTELIIGCCYCK